MFGAIAGGIASALAGGAMSKLFGGGQKAASGGIQGDVLATDNNTVGMGDAGIKSAIQGSNVRSEERFSRNAETDLVCRLLLEKKNIKHEDRTILDIDKPTMISIHLFSFYAFCYYLLFVLHSLFFF